MNCQHCNKALRAIGYDRSNGKDYMRDWSTRKYHKKCYKEIKQKEEIDYLVKKLFRN